MIDRFLRAAPRHAATVEESVLLAGWLQNEPPILELRRRQGIEASARSSSRCSSALGLKLASRDRLADAYHELETGQLDPAGVDASVWRALGRDPEGERARAGRLATAADRGRARVSRSRSPEMSVESQRCHPSRSRRGRRRGRSSLPCRQLTGSHLAGMSDKYDEPRAHDAARPLSRRLRRPRAARAGRVDRRGPTRPRRRARASST